MPVKHAGVIVMSVEGAPAYVVLVNGVLHIQTSCCGCDIKSSTRHTRVCSNCFNTIAVMTDGGPRWSPEYQLDMHTNDGHLTEWLSFWTGILEKDIQVEVMK